MKTLLIDDIRDIKADRIARTFDDGIFALKEQRWDVLYLDHDLADPNPAKTGYDVLNWLEANPEHLPVEIFLVTQNPVGREKMLKLIDRLYAGKETT